MRCSLPPLLRGVVPEHALVLSDPVTAQYPVCKTVALPLRRAYSSAARAAKRCGKPLTMTVRIRTCIAAIAPGGLTGSGRHDIVNRRMAMNNNYEARSHLLPTGRTAAADDTSRVLRVRRPTRNWQSWPRQSAIRLAFAFFACYRGKRLECAVRSSMSFLSRSRRSPSTSES